MFDINTKVVCIDDNFPPASGRHVRNFPVKGSIYTIRDIIPAQDGSGNHTTGVLLHEIHNPPSPVRPDWGECGFAPQRFREIKTDHAEEEVTTFATFTNCNHEPILPPCDD